MKTLPVALAFSTLLLASPVIGQQPRGRPEIPAGDAAIVARVPEGSSSSLGGPAVGNPNSADPSGPAPAGENYFTEGHIRLILQHAGYTDVTGLTKDKDSIWRGKAFKDDKIVDLAVDSRARIFSE